MFRRIRPAVLLLLLLLLLPAASPAQDADLVDIEEIAPDIVVDMRYATENNFTNRRLYVGDKCYLRRAVAQKLAAAQEILRPRGLGLKCWDCLRPHSVQWEMWKLFPDPRFVADPRKGSNHNRGIAVDVTLVDAEGRELEMPTGYDNFEVVDGTVPKAAANYMKLPPQQIENRAILRQAMEQAGFKGIRTEWWHFDGAARSAYPIAPEEVARPLLLE